MKLLLLLKYLLFFSLLFFTQKVSAQVVDIESKRITKNEKGLFGEMEFNGSYTENVQTIWQLSTQGKLLLENKNNNLLVFGDFGLVKSQNEDLINRGFGHFRFNQNLTKSKRLKFEAFQQVQYNRIQKINFRNLTGTGLRFKVLKTDSVSFFVGTSIMYEYEEVQEQAKPNRDPRLSSYISLDIPFNKIISLNNICYYQPLANQFLDFRIANQTTLKLKFNANFALKITFNYLEDSNPPIGIPNRIITLENGLSLNF